MSDYTLPKDISRCFNNKCPLKEECLRYLDRWNSLNISEFNVNNGKCEYQIKKK